MGADGLRVAGSQAVERVREQSATSTRHHDAHDILLGYNCDVAI